MTFRENLLPGHLLQCPVRREPCAVACLGSSGSRVAARMQIQKAPRNVLVSHPDVILNDALRGLRIRQMPGESDTCGGGATGKADWVKNDLNEVIKLTPLNGRRLGLSLPGNCAPAR